LLYTSALHQSTVLSL